MHFIDIIALQLGTIQADLTTQGNRIELADLIIGVTALQIGYGVVTRNINHFNRIPGLRTVPSPLKI